MAKLDEEFVAALIVEKFNVTQAQAWEFVDEVKNRIKAEPAEKGEGSERKKKEYVIVIADPNKALNLENYTGAIFEKLPSTVEENGSRIETSPEREWGDLETSNLLEVALGELKNKHSKKGPYECLGDIIELAPNKVLKKVGLKPITKSPVSLITFSSDKFDKVDSFVTLNSAIDFIK